MKTPIGWECELMKTIGKRLVFLRERYDIKQKDLAKAVHVTEASLSRYENDLREPKAEVIAALARELNTSADFILGLTADYSPKIKDEHWDSLSEAESIYINSYRNLNTENKLRLDERIKVLLEQQR